mmetsp:Transcript_36493/g.103835  ORF Transcript_36493/g.103835 Transcript_36493/m.103835 type:complete len:236 (+) Transcript_36493:566-1273(+)
MVMVWSAMVFWNSTFSFCRSSVAFCISSCTCLICLFAESISSAMVVMALSSSAILASRDSFWDVVFSIVSSLSWSSAWHQSFFFTSSACCCFSFATKSSMTCITFLKGWSRAASARRAKSGKRATLACANVTTSLLPALSLASCSCKKEAGPQVVCWPSRASSAVRISIASETALISSERICTRFSYSRSPASHLTVSSLRKASSAAKLAFASFKSSLFVHMPSLVFARSPPFSL